MDSIKRWVWSETEAVEGFTHPQPVVREYAYPWIAPNTTRERELVSCVFQNQSYLEAAQADPRVTVLPSLHSNDPIPKEIAEALANLGVSEGMTMHDMLATLAKTEPQYLPEQ